MFIKPTYFYFIFSVCLLLAKGSSGEELIMEFWASLDPDRCGALGRDRPVPA